MYELSEKITQKIKTLTTGSKYGLNPEGMDYEEVKSKLKLNKTIYKIILPLTILTAAVSIILLFANIYEIAPANYNTAPLLLLMTMALVANTLRLKAYIQKQDTAIFLFELKDELKSKDELAA